ncbi:MAG: DNA polymerase IV [Anaerolineales bacterium]|nr:DNA polymerase IV [Anaerolineales bacterium]
MEQVDTRKILHLDLDAFFCAVEEQLNPDLRGKPFAVGGKPEQRGVVASCSYPARKFGVRSAMPMYKALRLCPGLLIVSHHSSEYRRLSRKVMDILREVTPLVEQISIDEAFLDVTALDKSALQIAQQLQTRICSELELPCSLGVATNKLVAKVASEVGKAEAVEGQYPNAIQIVPPGDEAAFLAKLPAEALWGVGPKTAARLEEMGIHYIGDIARQDADEMERRFGQTGRDLVLRARGIDNREVIPIREAKSISQEITFAKDVSDARKIKDTLRQQSESISRHLKKSNLTGSTIKLKLRWHDFETITRQATLPQPTANSAEILAVAEVLLAQNWDARTPVRLIGVGVSNLQTPTRQLSLWDTQDYAKQNRLEQAVKELQARFGDSAIHRGGESDQ